MSIEILKIVKFGVILLGRDQKYIYHWISCRPKDPEECCCLGTSSSALHAHANNKKYEQTFTKNYNDKQEEAEGELRTNTIERRES